MLGIIQGWFMSTVNDYLYSLMSGFIEAFGSFINNIFNTVWEVNELLNFERMEKYTVRIALAYVVFKAVKQGLDVYVFETEGDPDSDPLELLTRVFQTSAIIYCGTWVINRLITIAGIMATDVIIKIPQVAEKEVEITESSFSNNFIKMIDTFYGASRYKGKAIGHILTLLCLAMLIATIIFVFHAGKRGAELTLFKILLPLVAVDLLTTSRDRWKQFFSEMMICIFGYIVQVFSFNVFLILIGNSVEDLSSMTNYLLAALGWLIVVVSAPKWLSKWMYSSGIGNGAKGGARSAAMLISGIIK